MRAFIFACVLNSVQEPADQAFTSPYARLGA